MCIYDFLLCNKLPRISCYVSAEWEGLVVNGNLYHIHVHSRELPKLYTDVASFDIDVSFGRPSTSWMAVNFDWDDTQCDASIVQSNLVNSHVLKLVTFVYFVIIFLETLN